MNKLKITFFGIGIMGEPMVHKLMEASHDLIVYNRTKNKTTSLEHLGAAVAINPDEGVKSGDVIIVMLADYKVIDAVFPDTINWKNKTVIQMSTIGPAESLKFKHRVEAKGGEYLEAPVLGGVPQLLNRTMQVLVGANETQFETWKGFFNIFSDYCFYVGRVGQAAGMKLALNQMALAQTASLSMSVGYLRNMGADVNQFMDILRNSVNYARGMERKLDTMMNRNYSEMRFPLKLLQKDGCLMRDNFRAEGIDVSPLDGITSVIQKAVDQGYGDADFMAVYEAFHPDV